MRVSFVLGVVFAALAVVPAAAATLDPVTVDPPTVKAWVKGQSFVVDSSDYVQGAPAVTGEVRTKDAEVTVDGPSCTIDPTQKLTKLKATRCGSADVSAPSEVDLVEYDVGLRFGELSPAPPASPTSAYAAASEAFAAVSNPTVLLAAAAAGVSLAGAYALWRTLKWTGLFALVPLYSHIRDDEILDDPNRAGIFRLIQAEPGISTKDVADRLDLAWGTVTHHLGKLEKRRFVVSKKYGKYRRYFANGEGGTEMKDQVAVLRLDRTGDIAELIRAQPGLTQKAVSNALGVSSSTILWHVKRLEGAQLITKVRDGKLVRYYPGDGLKTGLVTPVTTMA